MNLKSLNICLPGVDSTLAIDDWDRHANLCGESILANIPKVYQLPIGPEAKFFWSRLPGQSRTVRRVFRCGVAETCPFIFRLGWHVDEKGSAGKFKPFPWAARSSKNPSTSLLKAPLKTRWSIHQDSGFRSGNGSNRAVQNVRP